MSRLRGHARALRWALEELRRDDTTDAFSRAGGGSFRVDFVTRHGRRHGYEASGRTLDELSRSLVHRITHLEGGMVRIGNPDGQAFYAVGRSGELARVSDSSWEGFSQTLTPVGLGRVRSSLACRLHLEHTAQLIQRLWFHSPEQAHAAVDMFTGLLGRLQDTGFDMARAWRAVQHVDRVVDTLSARSAGANTFGHDLDEDLVDDARRRGAVGAALEGMEVTWRGVREVATGTVHVCSMFDEPGMHDPHVSALVGLIARGEVLA